MATSASGCGTLTATDQRVRTLRSTFRRCDEVIVCELRLSSDHRTYELRFNPPANPAGVTTERFDDAMSAFERHAAIERILVRDGWTLEAFDADRAVGTGRWSSIGAAIAESSRGGC
jgi:hypothetical protein